MQPPSNNDMGLSRLIKWIKIPFFLLCLAPVANLVWKGFHRELTANPLEYIRNSTGFWTLVFLCITLAVTPLRRLLHRNELVRFRRMVGLFAFFYSLLHFVTYIWFEQSFDFAAILNLIRRILSPSRRWSICCPASVVPLQRYG